MSENRCYLGLDLGGTKVLAVLTRSDGSVIEESTFLTEPQLGVEKILRRILVALQDLKKKSPSPVAALGIGVAGQVDQKTGDLHFAPNLNWKNVPLGTYLQNGLNLPVRVLNDVRAAVWGEWMLGSARGYQDVLGIFIGTGIGGGLISQGRLLEGSTGAACEIGHVTVDFHGSPCTCGNIGCVEAYAGGWGIARQAQVLMVEKPEEFNQKAKDLSARDVITLYRAGNPIAKKVLDQSVKALSAAVVTYLHMYNPKLLVFGGGLISGWPELPELVRKEVEHLAMEATLKGLEWKKSGLQNYAVARGAAAYAKSHSD